MEDALFIEDPVRRKLFKGAYGIGTALSGRQFASIIMEVSAETFLTQAFRDWFANGPMCRMAIPPGPITIMVK